MNKLDLKFELETAAERSKFLKEYLQDKNFSNSNLETCANYLLYGKDPDGKSPVQKKLVQVQTKRKTWDKDKTESLNFLMENPAFNEGVTKPITDVPTLVRRVVFSRSAALRETENDPELHTRFQNLFKQIDETELFTNFYEILNGKREKPPRDELLERVPIEDQERIRLAAHSATQKGYLLKRHELVELRKQQYTLRDSYKVQVFRHTFPVYQKPVLEAKLGIEIPVLPAGLFTENTKEIFQPFSVLMEKGGTAAFSVETLSKISKVFWEVQDKKNKEGFFDFSNSNHLYELFTLLEEFMNDTSGAPLGDRLDYTTKELFQTLSFYLKEAKLSDLERDLLRKKLRRVKNAQIAADLNKKYGTTHSENYISTIYTQRVLGKIADAAKLHHQILENIAFSEEFKKCNHCGRYLLLDNLFYTRRARANDGFSPTCKECEKIKRQERAKR